MSKVTITIDDSNPTLVSVFGSNTIDTIADEFGYMTMVEKSVEELPEKVEFIYTNPISGEVITDMVYPEGTEFYKENPESKAEFVGRIVLRDSIVPKLLSGFETRTKYTAVSNAEAAIKEAHNLVVSIAEISVI